MATSTIGRETGSKLRPISESELHAIGEELYDMHNGVRNYKTVYGIKNADGEKLDAVTNLYDDGSYDMTLDAEIDGDENYRIATYVHELIHTLRPEITSEDDWIVDDHLTGQALLGLYTHEDRNVREMAEKGYKAWQNRQLNKGMSFTRDDDGISSDEFSEYFVNHEAVNSVNQTSAEDRAPKENDVEKRLRYLKMPARERTLREELDAIDSKIEEIGNVYSGVEKSYGVQINSIDDESDSSKYAKDLAIDAGSSVIGAVEGLGRRVAKTPFGILDTFLANYSGGVIDVGTSQMISNEPNVAKGINGAMKNRGERSFEKKRAGKRATVEKQMKTELSTIQHNLSMLGTAKISKIEELATYLHNREKREGKKAKGNVRKEYLDYKGYIDEDKAEKLVDVILPDGREVYEAFPERKKKV